VQVLLLCVAKLASTTILPLSNGLLVIPGLGREDRLDTVVHSLRVLRTHYTNTLNVKWDCVVYIYAPRELTSFWSKSKELSYLYGECKVIEVPNKRVTENLYMVQPALIEQHYNRIIILLDDCKIQDPSSFNLTRILQIMDKERLTVVSPMVSFSCTSSPTRCSERGLKPTSFIFLRM
jgi:hypothetical protein